MSNQQTYPTVSLLLVVRNEVDYIEQVLESLASQQYPVELLEIIVVDGMSDDGSREIETVKLKEVSQQGIATKILDNPGLTLSKGWNIGIKAATGTVVCRVDAHSELDPKYVNSGVEFLIRNMDKKIAGVGGVLLNTGYGVLGKVFADFFSSKFAVGNSAFRVGVPRVVETDTAVFALYWREVFNRCGYFDESLSRNQDLELHNKLSQKGYKFFTNPEMKAKYYVRSTLRRFVGKAFNDGYWVAFLKQSALRHKAPMLFVLYLIMLLVGTSVLNHPLRLILLVPLFLYFVLDIAFAVKDAHCLWSKILMIGLYPLYHLSYGLGTLWAVITIPFKFLNRHKKKTGKLLADRKM